MYVRVAQVESFIWAVFVGVDDSEKKVYLLPPMPFKSNPRVASYLDPLGTQTRPPWLVFVRIYKHNPAVEWTEPDVSQRFIMFTKSRLHNIYCLFTLWKVSNEMKLSKWRAFKGRRKNVLQNTHSNFLNIIGWFFIREETKNDAKSIMIISVIDIRRVK